MGYTFELREVNGNPCYAWGPPTEKPQPEPLPADDELDQAINAIVGMEGLALDRWDFDAEDWDRLRCLVKVLNLQAVAELVRIVIDAKAAELHSAKYNDE